MNRLKTAPKAGGPNPGSAPGNARKSEKGVQNGQTGQTVECHNQMKRKGICL